MLMSKESNILTDLYKGQWAFDINSVGYFFKIANDIVSGKDITGNFKAKQLIEIYDDELQPVFKNSEGFYEIPEGSIAVMNMIGPIITYGDWWFYGADDYVSQLEKLYSNQNIKAVLIYMHGPGGAVSAISHFMEFGIKRDKKKPLGIVYEQCCSAHLYIAYGLQPDFVWAANNISANAGSLGVMLSYYDDTKWLEDLGVKRVQVYPDESKDKNLPYRMALEGNFDLIKKEMLSPLAQRFQEDMIRLIPNLNQKISGALTGKVFYSDQAIEVGFASKVGSLSEAKQYLQILSETNRYIN